MWGEVDRVGAGLRPALAEHSSAVLLFKTRNSARIVLGRARLSVVPLIGQEWAGPSRCGLLPDPALIFSRSRLDRARFGGRGCPPPARSNPVDLRSTGRVRDPPPHGPLDYPTQSQSRQRDAAAGGSEAAVAGICHPLPCPAPVFPHHGSGFAVFHQTVQHRGDRGQRIFVAQ